MAEVPGKYDSDAKRDDSMGFGFRRYLEISEACGEVALPRVLYCSLAGAYAAVFFFRSPASRCAALAFGAGLGFGSAYNECFHKVPGLSQITTFSVSKDGEGLRRPWLDRFFSRGT